MAKHESWISELPYNPLGRNYLQFNDGVFDCYHDDLNGTPNWGEDPEGPGGFGLFQLTLFRDPAINRDRTPNGQELWVWQENANTAARLIEFLQDSAFHYMHAQRSYAQIDGYPYISVPEHHVGNVTFTEQSDKVIEHAVTMKLYNGGVSGGYYCRWDRQDLEWVFDSLNTFDPPFNYVRLVCETYP